MRNLRLITFALFFPVLIAISGCSNKGTNGDSMPAAPSGLIGEAGSSSAIRLSWVDNSDNEHGFAVYRSQFGVYELAGAVAANEIIYTDEGLEDSVSYSYYVVATNGKGNSESSNIVAVSTAHSASAPLEPASPVPADSAAGQGVNVRLHWQCQDPDNENLKFDIYLGKDFPPALAHSQDSMTYVPLSTLDGSAQYYWRVVAIDASENRKSGPVWRFSTAEVDNQPPGAPNTPAPADGATGVATNAVLSWQATDPEGDAPTYDVYFGAEAAPPLVSADQSANSYTPGAMENGTAYHWRIVAKDTQQSQTSGPVWSFTTMAGNQPPGAPTNPWPADQQADVPIDAVASWNAADPDGDPLNFDIYFGLSNPPPFVGNQTAATYDPPGNLNNTSTYYWRVNVKDDHGNSTQGPVWRFTTAGVGNQPPGAPFNPSPQDLAIDVALDATLSWEGVDPEGDPLTFDVLFGTSSPPPFVGNQATRTYDPPGDLAVSTIYYWQIIAKDNRGHETPGPIWSFTTVGAGNQPPAAPSGPVPQAGAVNIAVTVALSWSATDPDGDPLNYDVLFGTSNPPPSVGNQTLTTYDPPGDLANSTTYYWQIVAHDDQGNQTAGPVWSFATGQLANQPPAPPSNPSPANGQQDVAVTTGLSWQGSDPDGDPLEYDIYFGTSTPPSFVRRQSEATYNPPGDLQSNTTYYWGIVANDGQGHETGGPTWSFRTEDNNRPPNAPSNPSPSNGQSGIDVNADLSWQASDPEGDALVYDVYFGTSSEPPQVSSDQSPSGYDPGTLQAGTTYRWRIVAQDPSGSQTSGPTWSFTTVEPNDPPSAPFDPNPSNGRSGVDIDDRVEWRATDPEDDPLTYDVYFGTSNPPPFVRNQDPRRYDPPGHMDEDRTYYWQIVVHDDHGNQTAGPIWSFRTEEGLVNLPPLAPSNPSPGSGATGIGVDVTLSWQGSDPNGDTLTYDVFFGTNESPPFVGNQAVSSYDPPGDLANGTTYYWMIIAHDTSLQTPGPLWSFTTAVGNQAPTTPAAPSPPDLAVSVDVATVLSWQSTDPEGDPLSFDVYFGTANPPPFVQNQLPLTFDPPGDMANGTTYYWSIVAHDNQGHSTAGPIWSFTTAAPVNTPPDPPGNPSPDDGAGGVAANIILSWTASDPDGDPITYDVYFGEVNPPPLVQNQGANSFDPPGDLAGSTVYYWQIVVRDQAAQTPGAVWSFTTAAPANQPPGAPANPSPGDGAIFVSPGASLSWEAVDPEGDPLTFDVYFGDANPPPFVQNQVESAFDPPGDMNAFTTYYWQIIAHDPQSQTAGPIWSFTTGLLAH